LEYIVSWSCEECEARESEYLETGWRAADYEESGEGFFGEDGSEREWE